MVELPEEAAPAAAALETAARAAPAVAQATAGAALAAETAACAAPSVAQATAGAALAAAAGVATACGALACRGVTPHTCSHVPVGAVMASGCEIAV